MHYFVLTSIIAITLLIYIIIYLKNESKEYFGTSDVLLNSEELYNHARELSLTHVVQRNKNVKNSLLYRLDKNFEEIEKIYIELNNKCNKNWDLPKASEWLLDNFYIIEIQYKKIRRNLENEKNLQLNILDNTVLRGYPRVYAIALELVSHTDGMVTEEILIDFVNAYQKESVLSIKEISSLSLMITIALMEHIKNLCEKINFIEEKWRKAEEINLDELSDIDKYVDDVNHFEFSFVEHLIKRIKKETEEPNAIIERIEKKLNYSNTSLQKVLEKEYTEQSSLRISMGNVITSLKTISNLNWNSIFESLCVVEKILRYDPSNIYENMDSASRSYYRYSVERLAKKLKVKEIYIAKKSIEYSLEEYNNGDRGKKSHVGYYLIDEGKGRLFHNLGRRYRKEYVDNILYYVGPILILTTTSTYFLSRYVYLKSNIGLAILAWIISFIPMSQIWVTFFNFIFSKIFEPSFLPKLEFKESIPSDKKTFVVIPALLTDEDRVKDLISQMEVYYLANREENLYFALLGDFKESEEEKLFNDEDIIKTGLDGVKQLNNKYSQDEDIFYYFHRDRVYLDKEDKWMGWERKRGALLEFNSLMLGDEDTSYTVISNSISHLVNNIKYVITLDADTILPIETARKLIGTISHPLNAPLFNENKGVVTEGYGLIQPRIVVDIESANSTLFTRIFAGQGGIDPYTTAISDIYQDMFKEGIFTGKGIYDLEIFQRALKDSIPENQILSHDLLEGSFVRVGLCTDIQLIDGFPSKYSSYMMRKHRWTRGDWQLIRWIGNRNWNPINSLSKWKILDNLRRSLVPVGLLLLIYLGLILFPGSIWAYLGIVLLSLFAPLVISFIEYIMYRNNRISQLKLNGNLIVGMKGTIYQIFLTFIFLAYEGYLIMDAIVRTIYRVYISNKNLLEWTTAQDMEKKLKNDLTSYYKRMKSSPIMALLLVCLVYISNKGNIYYALIISLLWAISPGVAYSISREDSIVRKQISEEDCELVRKISRKTWDYYENFADEKNNYLPPDNYQEFPYNGVAPRTSPTNIGFLFLSILSARDLGYITTSKMIEKIDETLSTVEKMDKWKGHIYNWYNTETLEPLRPCFISTVDSGNFVSYMIVLKEGLKEYLDRPIFDDTMLFGIRDTINLIEYESERNYFGDFLKDINSIEELFKKLSTSFPDEKDYKDKWAQETKQMLVEILDEYYRYFHLSTIDENLNLFKEDIVLKFSLNELNGFYNDILRKDHIDGKASDISIKLKENVEQTIFYIQRLIDRIDIIIDETDFTFLYDYDKDLFSIGFNLDENKLVNSYYDLLASEARITSYLAIIRGEVPSRHWFKIARPLVTNSGYRALASWTGTMFEYLMPCLVMREYENTLLNETYKTAIRVQKDYGDMKKVPWGISESGFFAFDTNLNYQYKAFGAPRLGFKRGLSDDLVISPYSTFLVLPFDWENAISNIKALISEGLEGDYGFYEAIDYTKGRLPNHTDKRIVKSYMTHHQGMIFISINNFLNNNIIRKRFHKNPYVKTGEILLQEKIPLNVIIAKESEEFFEYREVKKEEINAIRVYTKDDLDDIKCHMLSSGSFYSMITNRGTGYSKKDNLSLNRWRDDITLGRYGTFIYIKNLNTNEIWSAAYEPVRTEPDNYKVVFSNDKAVFTRKDGDIQTNMEMILLSEEYGEIRKLTLMNTGEEDIVLEVISYLEVVMDDINSDRSHPVFNNLFIKTEVYPEYETILANRRARGDEQKSLWMVHSVKDKENEISGFHYETNRLNFIGRGRNIYDPIALEKGLTNSVGNVLDPIMSLSKRVKVKAGKSVEIYFLTGLCNSRDEAVKIAQKYRDDINFGRAFDLAFTRSQTEIGYFNFNSNEIKLYENLLPQILFVNESRKKYYDVVIKNNKGQEGLWAYGISGDNPIVLVSIKNLEGIDALREALKAHEYWNFKGLNIDLVILSEDKSVYFQPLYESIRDSVFEVRGSVLNQRGGVFIINGNLISSEDKILLYTWARLVIKAEEGFSKIENIENDIPYVEFKGEKDYPSPYEKSSLELAYFNGYGGFYEDDMQYVIKLDDDLNTPLPWINVVANRDFGFIITERGGGFTWYKNSRENKLTPWYNDPIVDTPGEIIYLRDDDTGEVWNVTSSPIRKDGSYTVVHGSGFTKFYYDGFGINQELSIFIPINDSVKLNMLKLKNYSKTHRNITLYYFIRPVIGVDDDLTQYHLLTDMDEEENIFFINNLINTEFKGTILYIASSENIKSFTGNRKEFIGENGSLDNPDALKRERLSNTVGYGYDPCCAIEIELKFEPNEEKEVIFLLGAERNMEDCYSTKGKYIFPKSADKELENVKDYWKEHLNVLQVETPDETMDLMINNWLMYQTIASRLWSRAGFYQVGGAFGARDQIQDAVNTLYLSPNIAREMILNNFKHQFVEGDMQHWWHPVPDVEVHKGIRSRYSDDYLWTPYAVKEYLKVTEDFSIFHEKVPFIESEELRDDEMERYEIPRLSEKNATVYEHCIRAIERSLKFGNHGIPLMGSGDWNDGMNRVGYKGKGESVWLGWFIADILKDFIPICKAMGEEDRGYRYEKVLENLVDSIEKNAWNGEWYIRAFFDDGKPLGSQECNECAIDSIAQSWAVISGFGKNDRVEKAMESVEKYLVKEEEGMVLLFTPPFDDIDQNPGYIKSYIPGVRENGGQYTHAACWVIIAFSMMDKGDEAWKIFNLLNPINHSRTPIECAKYKLEPYVCAADVYMAEPHVGRGGWSWYTGSAGWFYRAGVEYILGFKKRGNKLYIDPSIPKDWEGYTIKYRFGETIYKIEVKNPSNVNAGVNYLKVNGTKIDEKYLELADDGKEYFVEVFLGSYKDVN